MFRTQDRSFSCSSTWAALKKGKEIFNKGTKWIPGRESGLSLWYDKWMDNGNLQSLISGPLNKDEENLKLKDVVGFTGWNLEHVSFSFPTPILLEMKATPFSFSCRDEDRLTWHLSSNGEFKLREAYQLANKKAKDLSRTPFSGTWVWKILSLPKIKHLLWQCCHFSIAVKATLNERGMGIPPVCPVCNSKLETIVHALRDCPKAKCFWNSLMPPLTPNIFYGMPLVEWLKLNCRCSRFSASSNIEWGTIFPMAVWIFWLHRNNIVFGRTRPHRNLVDETLARATKVAYLVSNGKQITNRNKIQVRWLNPSSNWFKLNSNGSSRGNPGLAGGGGLIRNDKGEWVKGYARAIDITTSVAAEL